MAVRPPAADPAPDDLIDGRYRLVELVARGDSAAVWRGHDERLSRAVAIKLLAADHTGQRGRDEARALARLSHPHIAEVFDYGRHDGRAYLVLELVDGWSLADVLARRDLARLGKCRRAGRGRARGGPLAGARPRRRDAGQHHAHSERHQAHRLRHQRGPR